MHVDCIRKLLKKPNLTVSQHHGPSCEDIPVSILRLLLSAGSVGEIFSILFSTGDGGAWFTWLMERARLLSWVSIDSLFFRRLYLALELDGYKDSKRSRKLWCKQKAGEMSCRLSETAI